MTRRLLATAAAGLLVAGCSGRAEHDSGQIAFARAPATNAFSDLYLTRADGSLRRLTHGGVDTVPVWSPDGRRIAFQRVTRERTSLHIANADGSGQRELPDPVSGTIDWSPDSRRLVESDDGKLYVAGADGGSRTLLLELSPLRAEDPRWSPDGRRIVFALGTDLGGDVWTMNVDGSGRRRLTRLGRDAGRPASPSWSPDGRRIAFLLPGSLRVIDAEGSGAKVLARFPDDVFPSSPAWSPDGETLAFARLRLGGNPLRSGIYVVDADGSALHRLTRAIDSNLSWSPDGRQIAFQRLTGFHVLEITVMDRDGGNQRSLTSGGWADTTPAWRPSGG